MSEYNIQMNKYNALNAEYDQLYPATKIKNVDGLGTALQNKAPSGFGLGEEIGKDVPDQSTMDITFANGWYKCAFAVTPFNTGGTLFVIGRGRSNYVVQQYYPSGSALKLTYGMRSYNGTSWSDWEWVNPPMNLGVEYRTTERYLGNPVYVKLVDCGSLPNTTIKTIEHGTEILKAISCTLSLTSTSGYPRTAPEINSDKTVSVFAQLDRGYIHIMANRDFSKFTAVAKIKYTKTTD